MINYEIINRVVMMEMLMGLLVHVPSVQRGSTDEELLLLTQSLHVTSLNLSFMNILNFTFISFGRV